MILSDVGIMADLVPVTGKPGWFELTGDGIDILESYEECIEQELECGCRIVEGAQIRNWHNDEISYADVRLSGRAPKSLLVFEFGENKFRLFLEVSLPERDLFTLLITKDYESKSGMASSFYRDEGQDAPPLEIDEFSVYRNKLKKLKNYKLPVRLTVDSANEFLSKTGAGFKLIKSEQGYIDMVLANQEIQKTTFGTVRKFMDAVMA